MNETATLNSGANSIFAGMTDVSMETVFFFILSLLFQATDLHRFELVYFSL